MTDDELFKKASDINLAFKDAISEVQLEVFDGEWRVRDYGDFPEECADGQFEFRMSRGTPSGWHLDGPPMELAERVAAWLDENGWSDIKLRGYSGEIADVLVEAEYPDKNVELLTVDISPGEAFDSVVIYGTSTCEPGDSSRLFDLVYADGDLPGPPVEMLPEVEHPSAEPSFGFRPDGKRRFSSDSE